MTTNNNIAAIEITTRPATIADRIEGYIRMKIYMARFRISKALRTLSMERSRRNRNTSIG